MKLGVTDYTRYSRGLAGYKQASFTRSVVVFCGCEMYFFVVDGCVVNDLNCGCICYVVFGF